MLHKDKHGNIIIIHFYLLKDHFSNKRLNVSFPHQSTLGYYDPFALILVI